MKKPINQILGANNRQLLLRGLARLHFGLAAALLFAAFFELLGLYGMLSCSPYQAFFRGLLMALPAALSYYAVKRLRAMWQYLLASLCLCGLSWLLAGHLGGVLATALVCFFRGRVRLQEEEEGPIRSMFDYPAYPVLGLFGAAFLLSALLGTPALQRLSLLGAVLYLLVCIAYKGLARVDEYLSLNQAMHRLPARRIQRISGAAVAASTLLAALLLLPPVLGASGGVRIHLPDPSSGQTAQVQLEEASVQAPALDPGELLREQFGTGNSWHIPEFVTYLLLGVTGAFLAAGLAFALWRLVKDFGRSYTDSRDYVQRLTKDEPDSASAAPAVRRPPVWDRSPNAVIRRRYRRAILKAGGGPPQSSLTPAQLEEWAGLQAPRLHWLYEKARYGPEPCSDAEAKEAGKLGV